MASKKISNYPLTSKAGTEKFIVEKSNGVYAGMLTTELLSGLADPAVGFDAIKVETFKRVDLGTVSSGTATLDLSQGNYFTLTVGGALTIAISNAPSGSVVSNFGLRLTNGGSAVVTFPATVAWGGTAPTLTASGRDLLTFLSDDNGASWISIGRSLNI